MPTRYVRAGVVMAAAVVTVATVAIVGAQGQGQAQGQEPALARVARATGYLDAAAMPDVKQIVPPPPKEGDSRFATWRSSARRGASRAPTAGRSPRRTMNCRRRR